MIVVDLVTGFLGAGKTTFIRKYVEYLKKNNQQIRIIENEFGEESVDTHLLEDQCQVTDLSGMCMCCVGKDAFINMLIQAAEASCDRIIVEPSGIYDVDEFFEVMTLPKVAEKCQIGNIITIVDLMQLEYLLDEAEYLLFTQVLASGIVVISKRDLMDEATYNHGIEKLNSLMQNYGCSNGIMADVISRNLNQLSADDFEEIADSAYARIIHDRQEFVHSEIFESAVVKADFRNYEDIVQKLSAIFESPSCGRVYRIKGFKNTLDGKKFEINATADNITIEPSDVKEDMLVVIGQYIRVQDIEEKLV